MDRPLLRQHSCPTPRPAPQAAGRVLHKHCAASSVCPMTTAPAPFCRWQQSGRAAPRPAAQQAAPAAAATVMERAAMVAPGRAEPHSSRSTAPSWCCCATPSAVCLQHMACPASIKTPSHMPQVGWARVVATGAPPAACSTPALWKPSPLSAPAAPLPVPAVAWLLGDQRQQLEAALAAPDAQAAAATAGHAALAALACGSDVQGWTARVCCLAGQHMTLPLTAVLCDGTDDCGGCVSSTKFLGMVQQ